VDQVLELTRGEGADRGCECVGYQCHEPHGREVPNLAMNNLVNSVRLTGGTGVVGIFLPKDHGAADQLAKDGEIAFDMASSDSRGSLLEPAKPTSSITTDTYATLFAPAGQGRHGSFGVGFLWTRLPTLTSILTRATTGGRKWC